MAQVARFVLTVILTLSLIALVMLLAGCASAPPVPMTCLIEFNGRCLACEPIPDAWGLADSEAWKGRNGP